MVGYIYYTLYTILIGLGIFNALITKRDEAHGETKREGNEIA